MIDKTKAAVPPPPSRGLRSDFLGKVAAPTFVPDNMDGEKLKDVNFKMTIDFHTKFKSVATARRMSMKELLEASFAAYLEKHGIDI